MSRATWTEAVIAANCIGATGRTCLLLLAEHRVLELPMLVGCLGLHYETVREALGRLERRRLVTVIRSQSVPARPSRWFLTSLGARTAVVLNPDPNWDPRPVASKRPEHATLHDLALANLRLTIFRPHWRDVVVQRGRKYMQNGPVVLADRAFRTALATHQADWEAGRHGPMPQEPAVRMLARRSLGLPLAAEILPRSATLIPDLYWGAGPGLLPVLIEYEGRRTTGKVVWAKAIHLAGYCHDHPARCVLVYPCRTDARAMVSVWKRVLKRLPSGLQLGVTITSMEALWDARQLMAGGLSLMPPIPEAVQVMSPRSE